MSGNLSPISSKTWQLLACLREDSREKLTEISKKTNIPISSLFDLLKELENGVITKHTTLIDFSKLGYHTKAQVFLKVDKTKKEELKKHLCFHPQINTVYKINNGWDFIIETVHQNIKELDQFLEQLNHKFDLQEQQVHYLIEDLKREGFVVETDSYNSNSKVNS